MEPAADDVQTLKQKVIPAFIYGSYCIAEPESELDRKSDFAQFRGFMLGTALFVIYTSMEGWKGETPEFDKLGQILETNVFTGLTEIQYSTGRIKKEDMRKAVVARFDTMKSEVEKVLWNN